MIQNLKNKKPILTFGLGRTSRTIALGETITLYQTTIYNSDDYELLFKFMAKNLYSFDYTPTVVGTETLQVNIVTKDRKINMVSNEIELTVI